ncbi:MAG: transcriptional repressor LexA [Gammaproteobacteria bacterium]
MKKITSQQQKVLECIEVYIKETGFPPTRIEICKELGFKSPNAAEMHLRALERKGLITIKSGSSRGICLNNKTVFDGYPVIGLVAAGSPTLAEENIEKIINCDPELFGSNFDYFLKVKGLSMIEAGILENDLVAIKKTTEIKNGDLVVARIDEEVTLKHFFKSQNKIELRPANKDYSVITIDDKVSHFEIEGKGIGLLRNH